MSHAVRCYKSSGEGLLCCEWCHNRINMDTTKVERHQSTCHPMAADTDNVVRLHTSTQEQLQSCDIVVMLLWHWLCPSPVLCSCFSRRPRWQLLLLWQPQHVLVKQGRSRLFVTSTCGEVFGTSSLHVNSSTGKANAKFSLDDLIMCWVLNTLVIAVYWKG